MGINPLIEALVFIDISHPHMYLELTIVDPMELTIAEVDPMELTTAGHLEFTIAEGEVEGQGNTGFLNRNTVVFGKNLIIYPNLSQFKLIVLTRK
jgi:hypothetical protein